MIRELAALVDAATRPGGAYWTVAAVGTGAQAGKVQLKRTSTGASTRWIPYAAGLTLAVNDRVELVGGVNGGLVTAKI